MFYWVWHEPVFSLTLSLSPLICPNIFLFLFLSPFTPPPPISFLSPVISTVQLTASVLWVSALALSFIQPLSALCEPVGRLLPSFYFCMKILVSAFITLLTLSFLPPTCHSRQLQQSSINKSAVTLPITAPLHLGVCDSGWAVVVFVVGSVSYWWFQGCRS